MTPARIDELLRNFADSISACDDALVWVKPDELRDTIAALERLKSYTTDRKGWICSVCYRWNETKDDDCRHFHGWMKP